MRSIARLTSVGLLTALAVATFVACKKEKEQNGPSIIIPNETGIIAGDVTTDPGSYTVNFKVLFQKGSGKDDADLKDFSFSFNSGAGNTPVITNRPALNGTSFTFDTSFTINGTAGQVYTYTFTIRDKNDKTASRSFKITFGQSGGGQQPTGVIDSLMNQPVINNPDNKGSHIRYTGTALFTQTRTNADANPEQILFVYFYSSSLNRHSLISPAILGTSLYNNTPVEWDNTNTQTTNFRDPPTATDFNSVTPQGIVNAYNNGQNISEEFTNNGTQRVECTTGRIIAFKQGNIHGLVRVDNATVSPNPVAATISIKVARP